MHHKQISRDRFLDVGFTPATREEIASRVSEENRDKEGYIAGWASTEAIDSYDSVILAGAFEQSIKDRGLKGPKSVKLLLHHDREKVAGVITRLEYVGPRLWIEAQLALSVGYVRDVYELSKVTGGLNFSVGFYITDYRFGAEGDDDEDILYIIKGDLIEVSVVTFPANDDCTMEIVRDHPNKTISDFEKSLVSQGIVRSRNDAKRITLAVKRDLQIFGASVSQDDAEAKTKRPRLDDHLAEIDEAIRSLRSSIAPVAQPEK